MKNKNLILGFSFIILVIIGFSYLEINKKFYEKFENDLLIKNISWNTNFLDSVPYKKDDELELNLIIKNLGENKVIINKDLLKNKFNIKDIFINDQKKNIDDLVINNGDGIKIILKTKDNGIIKKEDYKNIVKDIQKIKDEKEVKKEEEIPKVTKKINIKLEKDNINSNINNLIEISGEGKEFIKYVNIGGISLTPVIFGNKTYLSISKNTFSTGEYFIILQLTDGEIISTEQKINFIHDNSSVNIANITPNIIKNDTDKYIVLQGNGFSKIISIQLSNNVVLKNTSFDIINDNVLSVKIPAKLSSGEYYLNIMTNQSINTLKNNTFTIIP